MLEVDSDVKVYWKGTALEFPWHMRSLFTGCDTGFGFELAKHLHSLECKVYAGCLFKDGEGGKELAELGLYNHTFGTQISTAYRI